MSLYLEIASKEHLTPIAASTTFSHARRPAWTQTLACVCVRARASEAKPPCHELLLAWFFCVVCRSHSAIFAPVFWSCVMPRGVTRHHFTLRCRGSSHTHTHFFFALISGIKLTGQQPPTRCCFEGGHWAQKKIIFRRLAVT